MNNLTKILIGITLILIIGTAYYFLDYQSNEKFRKTTEKIQTPDYIIYQGNISVGYYQGEAQLQGNCVVVKEYTFCGSFTIKDNK